MITGFTVRPRGQGAWGRAENLEDALALVRSASNAGLLHVLLVAEYDDGTSRIVIDRQPAAAEADEYVSLAALA